MYNSDELKHRAEEYAQRNGWVLVDQLGYGMHGIVFAADSQPGKEMPALRAAIKVYWREQEYVRELKVYLHLQERDVTMIRACHVPQLLHFDNELWVISMTMVKRPFVLDFAGAYLDGKPDFSEEVLADWRAEKQEQFGAHWKEVQAVLWALEQLGVYMVDVNPGNISFGA